MGRAALLWLIGIPLPIILIVWLLGGSHSVALSMAPKAVTTPIAMGVSQQIGGVPALPTRFPIFPPEAARRWSFWLGSSSRASLLCPTKPKTEALSRKLRRLRAPTLTARNDRSRNLRSRAR